MERCILIFSLFQIVKKIYGYYHDDKQYQEIRSQVSSDNASQRFEKVFENTLTDKDNKQQQENSDSETSDQQIIPYKVEMGSPDELNDDGIFLEYSKLKELNPDMIGWIQMPGFKKVLDYPLMYSGDNEFYLDKDFYNNYSYAGSIFMDSRNNPIQVDEHITAITTSTSTTVTLDPPFDTKYREFAAQLPSYADGVSLDVKTADPKARFIITLNDEKTDTEELPIDYGENIIKIKVISQDDLYARTYTVRVTRIPEETMEVEPTVTSETGLLEGTETSQTTEIAQTTE